MSQPLSSTKPSVSQKGEASETMIWVSGGVFVVSCTLLFLFVAHILYESVQTHWPRRVALLERADGLLIGGEIHGPAGRSATVEQDGILIRLGSHKSDQQSFATVSKRLLVDRSPLYPPNVLALEMRDSDMVFGFVTKLTQLQHSLQKNGAVARVIQNEIIAASNRGRNAFSSQNAFEQILPSSLETLLQQANEANEIPTEQWEESLATFDQIIARNLQTIETKQFELSEVDQQLAAIRKQVFKRGGDDAPLYLKSIDEIFRLSFELGAAEQAIFDLEASCNFWKDQFSDEAIQRGLAETYERLNSDLGLERSRLSVELYLQVDQDAKSIAQHTQHNFEEVLSFLKGTAESAKSEYAKQLRVNTELAELDLIRNAFQIEMAVISCVPALSSIADRSTVPLQPNGLTHIEQNQTRTYYWRPTNPEPVAVYQLEGKQILCADIVRYYFPNTLGWSSKLGLYFERWVEFLVSNPRRNGLAGGIFPAIWGTVVMTILMSIMVMPFGIMAAIYMREYAQHGVMLSVVRVTVNNLAGVPSIVYGVFGLAFFSYLIGGYIDGGPSKIGLEPMAVSSWSLLAVVSVIAIVWLAFRTLKPETLHSRPHRAAMERLFSLVLLIVALVGSVIVIAKVPFFDGLYNDELPNPTFGKGCLLWASFTMALLTLPIVIVTTEEALASVPASLKEGSYACGATKWQTIQRLVLPYARPGIITGMILSVARGAGEVAPLMLVGVIPLSSDLPFDTEAPFLHGSRSFMHLGYHIYSLGLQNSDANSACPMVYATIVLLLLIVFVLNSSAIWLRSKINRQIKSNHF